MRIRELYSTFSIVYLDELCHVCFLIIEPLMLLRTEHFIPPPESFTKM